MKRLRGMSGLLAGLACLCLVTSASAGPGDRAMYFEGRGQALVYPFWTVENADTLFEIVNGLTGFGGTPQRGRWVLVMVRVRDAASADVLSSPICLSPGDVWTGALTLLGGATHLLSNDQTGSGLGPAPVDATLSGGAGGSNPTRGYIEVVMIDNGLTQATGCNGSHGDADFSPGSEEDGTDQPLFGRLIYLSANGGLSGGFNAEAIKDLDPDRELLSGTLHGSARAFQALALGRDRGSIVGALLGRWLVDQTIGADTQVIVTFPLGTQSFNLCGGEPDTPFGTFMNPCTTTVPLDFSFPATATLWIRDDEEAVNLSPRRVPLGHEVNVLTLSDFPGVTRVPGSGKAGWFRLLVDANEDEVTDPISGELQEAGPVLTTVRVPRVLPAVGFTVISVQFGAQGRTFLFPFQTQPPALLFDCATAVGFSCTK